MVLKGFSSSNCTKKTKFLVTGPLRKKCSSQHSWEDKHTIWEVLGKDSDESKQRQFPQVCGFLFGTIPIYSYGILPRSTKRKQPRAKWS